MFLKLLTFLSIVKVHGYGDVLAIRKPVRTKTTRDGLVKTRGNQSDKAIYIYMR